MLKKEESTSVILHLEPVPHGDNNDITGTCTTVLAIETPHDESQAEGEEVEYGYPITCGDCSAVLLIKKFVCPGINVRCVKFNNELISPKQFVQLSGKATLKDWKRAIRLGGVMLRKMMDSGQIDFYQHSTICSNTCRSTKCEVQMSRTVIHPSPSCVTGEDFNDAKGAEEFSEVKSAPTEMGVSPNQFHKPTTTNGHFAEGEGSDSSDAVLSLWKTVAHSGLMGDVMSSVQSKLLMTFKEIEARSMTDSLRVKDAVVLNTLCEMFGLLESVEQAAAIRQHLNDENEIHCYFYGTNRTLKKRKRIEKNSTCKASSSKQLRLQPHGSLANSLNILSPVTTSPVIFPLSAFGLSEHTMSPLHSGRFSAPISTDTAPSVQLSDKSIGDGQKAKPVRRLRENSNLRRQGVDEEAMGGREKQRETRQRTATSENKLQHGEEEAGSDS